MYTSVGFGWKEFWLKRELAAVVSMIRYKSRAKLSCVLQILLWVTLHRFPPYGENKRNTLIHFYNGAYVKISLIK